MLLPFSPCPFSFPVAPGSREARGCFCSIPSIISTLLRQLPPCLHFVTQIGVRQQPMDCSMATPSGVSMVASWHVSWTIDRIFNGRPYGTPHDHSAHHEKCHDIMAYTMTSHGVCHDVAHGIETSWCIPWCNPRKVKVVVRPMGLFH